MLTVGLTGNIASGKSAVADVWARAGARIVDADELARRAVAPGTKGLERGIRRVGDGVLGTDGTLDRGALRDVVFADANARADLEAIVHPVVAALRLDEEAKAAAEGERALVHVVPLLFEAGLADAFDMIVLVDASPEVRLARLVERRGLEAVVARRMIEAQTPSEQNRARADIVLRNTGTLEELETEAAEAWRAIERRAAAFV
jgi:dephospho-CoA kinase